MGMASRYPVIDSRFEGNTETVDKSEVNSNQDSLAVDKYGLVSSEAGSVV
jgi:hypothetical protein